MATDRSRSSMVDPARSQAVDLPRVLVGIAAQTYAPDEVKAVPASLDCALDASTSDLFARMGTRARDLTRGAQIIGLRRPLELDAFATDLRVAHGGGTLCTRPRQISTWVARQVCRYGWRRKRAL